MTATMAVTPRPCVSLRRHGQLDVTLARLVQLGTVDATLAAFLAAAVRSRCNLIVTGGVNAGKTTLLRGLAAEIPPGERVATLKSEYELFLHGTQQHPDVIAFEAREPNSEGAGGISLHDLIAHALRHNPQRILVGEVRRSEIMPMLEAMNSGQEGSMCTLHANSPEEAFDRILILGLRGGLSLAERRPRPRLCPPGRRGCARRPRVVAQALCGLGGVGKTQVKTGQADPFDLDGAIPERLHRTRSREAERHRHCSVHSAMCCGRAKESLGGPARGNDLQSP
jgi:hypothetical protein